MPDLCPENVVVASGRVWPVHDLVDRVGPALDGAGIAAPAALVAVDELDLLSAAGWLAAGGRDGMVLPRERLTDSVLRRLAAEGLTIVDVASGRVRHRGDGSVVPGRVHLLTSGSTGEPKLIRHTWASLFTMARVRAPRATRWLLTYQAGTYAWYQLVTALLFMPGQSLVLPGGAEPAEMLALAARHGVSAISSTPTFWRVALLQATAPEIEQLRPGLERVTLGGEPVDQAILDQLRALFPAAQLVHIYASAEAGASIVVSDGRAGFPAAWLDDPARSPQLRVVDGRLWIRSAQAAIGFEDWRDTEDVAEIREGRVHLVGRAGHATINVGGAKALAADIERVLLDHPFVLWCRVRGVRAPLVGQLVAAEIVARPEHAAEPLPEPELTAYCAERLPPHMVPRVWERLERIPAAANWKTEV